MVLPQIIARIRWSENLQTPQFSNGNDESAEAIRAWLRDVIARTGMKPTPLAKAAGLAPSTLLRALDEEHPGSLERRSIDKIVQKFNVAPPIFYREGANVRGPGFSEPEVVIPKDDEEIFGALEPDQGVWLIQTRALELAGYLPGDRIQADRRVMPRSRDAVVAQVVDHALGTAETVIRIYDPPYLLTETSDPSARKKPLLVDNDRVSIWGTVIKMIRSRV